MSAIANKGKTAQARLKLFEGLLKKQLQQVAKHLGNAAPSTDTKSVLVHKVLECEKFELTKHALFHDDGYPELFLVSI